MVKMSERKYCVRGLKRFRPHCIVNGVTNVDFYLLRVHDRAINLCHMCSLSVSLVSLFSLTLCLSLYCSAIFWTQSYVCCRCLDRARLNEAAVYHIVPSEQTQLLFLYLWPYLSCVLNNPSKVSTPV